METILNLLVLTPEEREAFQAAAPGLSQRFAPGGRPLPGQPELTEADYAQATVILGNPPAARLGEGCALRWLHTRSAGVDAYTVPGVLPQGARLSCSTGAYGHSVSEHLFAMLLALMKHLPEYRDQQNRCQWRDLGQARTLAGAQVLVVGAGDLGVSFARLCSAFGAEITGIRRDTATPVAGISSLHTLEALDQLLPTADVVCLTLPHSPQTVRLFDRERLLRMKPDAILLNGGRGSVLDCQALAEVLAEGHLWGAGLDVTDPEPLPPEHPLWRQPRAFITPHAAGGDHLPDTARAIARIALNALTCYVNGQPLPNQIL